MPKGQKILAPVEFKMILDTSYVDYNDSSIKREHIQSAIIHKGKLDEIDFSILEYIVEIYSHICKRIRSLLC